MNLTGWTCSLLFAACSALASDPVLVNVDEANPPFMHGRQEEALGLYPRLIRGAFKHMNVAVIVEAKPWRRALAEIETGKVGVGGLYKNVERTSKFDFSDRIFIEKLVVYFNTGRPVSFNRTGDLRGKRIGVLRGWSYGDEFDNLRQSGECTVEEVSSDDQNFRKLASNRLDVVIAVSEAGSALAPNYQQIGSAPTPLALNPTYLAFSKSSNRTALLKLFDAAIKEMQKSGEFQKIVAEELAR